MSKLAGDLKVGNIIEYENGKFKVMKTEHVKPGKGGAFCRTTLQNIEKAQKKEITFRVEEKLNILNIYEKTGTFLYKNDLEYVFLEISTCEEFRCNEPSCKNFLTEGCEVILVIDDMDNLLTINLPKVIICEVYMTAGYISGQSVSSQEKSATLTNGEVVKVPQHIKDGDKIKINTETMEFNSKA